MTRVFEGPYQIIQTFIQMSPDEARGLFNCAQKVLDKGIIVEIGTWKGGSAYILGKAVEGRNVKVYSVDNYSEERLKNELITKKLTKIRLKEWGCDNVRLIKGESIEISKKFSDNSVDMIFIDGSHNYKDIKNDFENWYPKLKEGAIICFHDYGSWPDVTQLVDEVIHQRKITNNSFIALIK